MIRLILLLSLVFSSAYAYKIPKQGTNRDKIANIRASKHPKGSGVGTTRYNVKYTREYNVDRYKRK